MRHVFSLARPRESGGARRAEEIERGRGGTHLSIGSHSGENNVVSLASLESIDCRKKNLLPSCRVIIDVGFRKTFVLGGHARQEKEEGSERVTRMGVRTCVLCADTHERAPERHNVDDARNTSDKTGRRLLSNSLRSFHTRSIKTLPHLPARTEREAGDHVC